MAKENLLACAVGVERGNVGSSGGDQECTREGSHEIKGQHRKESLHQKRAGRRRVLHSFTTRVFPLRYAVDLSFVSTDSGRGCAASHRKTERRCLSGLRQRCHPL